MNNIQLSFLQKNGYTIKEKKLINKNNYMPPFHILYDNETKKFYIGIFNLSIYEYDFINFTNDFKEISKLVKKLNSMK